MNKFVILFALLAVIHASSGLTCKQCDDFTDPKCEKTKDQTCSAATDNTKPVCVWKVIKDANNKEYTTKQCGMRANNKPKYECAENKDRIVKCDSCETDLCNSASAIGVNAVAVSLIAALLASKFF